MLSNVTAARTRKENPPPGVSIEQVLVVTHVVLVAKI